MALNNSQIALEVEKHGHTLVSSMDYKNLSSWIEVKCSKGHIYQTTIEKLRKSKVCAACSRDIVRLEGYPPTKKGHRVVSIDQATHVTGVSVFDDGKLVYASIRNFYGELEERYSSFALFLTHEVFKTWEADELVFEDIQYQNNVMTFKTLAGLYGICTLMCALVDLPHSSYLNKVWQSTFGITGKDRHTQERNAVLKVEELFGITVPIDIADSILLGYHSIIKNGTKLF